MSPIRSQLKGKAATTATVEVAVEVAVALAVQTLCKPCEYHCCFVFYRGAWLGSVAACGLRPALVVHKLVPLPAKGQAVGLTNNKQ